MVTDPPYGIGFMGKDWDRALPDRRIWAECLRVLKDGSFSFVMSIPRADCLARMIISLEDVGFEVGFSPIYWAYASGFPKAQNIGKAVDKRNGRLAEEYKALSEYLRKQRGNRPQKDIAKFFPSKTGGLTGCIANWELGLNVPTKEQWQILKHELNLDNRFDALIEREEAEREVIFSKGSGRKRDNTSFSKGLPIKEEFSEPTTPQAKALDGSYAGLQLKPAVEVILVAMKPLSEKTYVEQALHNGKGVTWLDACRIPYESEGDFKENWRQEKGSHSAFFDNADGQGIQINPQGRFPANLLVSDDVLNDGRERISGGGNKNTKNRLSYGGLLGKGNGLGVGGDSGSFSRYFDLDKWAQKTFPFLIVPKASKAEKNRGCEGLGERPKLNHNLLASGFRTDLRSSKGGYDNKSAQPLSNNHPTCKPVKLMSYLITLGSREGDTVLDPFMGSGTTGVACQLLNRKFIGYEIDAGYFEIAEARLCRQLI